MASFENLKRAVPFFVLRSFVQVSGPGKVSFWTPERFSRWWPIQFSSSQYPQKSIWTKLICLFVISIFCVKKENLKSWSLTSILCSVSDPCKPCVWLSFFTFRIHLLISSNLKSKKRNPLRFAFIHLLTRSDLPSYAFLSSFFSLSSFFNFGQIFYMYVSFASL